MKTTNNPKSLRLQTRVRAGYLSTQGTIDPSTGSTIDPAPRAAIDPYARTATSTATR